MKKRMWFLGLVFAAALMLGGCGDGSAVYVQSVEVLSSMGGIAPGDRFAGIVVSEMSPRSKKIRKKQ